MLTPHPIRTAKLSTIGPNQYCSGGPCGNLRCWRATCFSVFSFFSLFDVFWPFEWEYFVKNLSKFGSKLIWYRRTSWWCHILLLDEFPRSKFQKTDKNSVLFARTPHNFLYLGLIDLKIVASCSSQFFLSGEYPLAMLYSNFNFSLRKRFCENCRAQKEIKAIIVNTYAAHKHPKL